MTTFITGNADKLRELQRLFPDSLNLTHKKLDLTEIQSLDLHKIISHKLREAYADIGGPVMVEDVAAGLESQNGLPGPFIRFYMDQLGDDALYKIGSPNDRATITCTMGYYDGETELIVEGAIQGRVVAARGQDGFGFDFIIVPNGYNQTIAELGSDVKSAISHRALAVKEMIKALQQAGIC